MHIYWSTSPEPDPNKNLAGETEGLRLTFEIPSWANKIIGH